MNEEFAKGVPLRLSALARIPSTFAGHYDLAAYLVMLIPLLGSVIFAFRRWWVKISLFLIALSGVVLLLMTASRVSFMVYLLAISFMLVLQRQKKLIIPVVLLSILLLNSFQGMSQRFGSTISQVDVVVDARTGKAIGIARDISEEPSGGKKSVVIEDVQSTGENLPQGTGFINFPSDATSEGVEKLVYKRTKIQAGEKSEEITSVEGNFVVKRVLAYDISFTTRFQGQWPRALDAFKRNVFIGSGYSSISLATDNDYLRMLGEVGIIGFASFIFIFLAFSAYVKKVFPDIQSKLSKSYVIGVVAAIFGIGLNAVLIDVFEASKVAFVMWLLIGAAVGILYSSQKTKFNVVHDVYKMITSSYAVAIYLIILAFTVYSVSVTNYFTANDFTWLRWVADCKKVAYQNGGVDCQPMQDTIASYFTNADGFFYRPGTKIYFLFMYSMFWMNAFAYHAASIFIHGLCALLIFLISSKILKSKMFAFIVSLFFIVLSGSSEGVFWISSTGHLISSAAILAALLFYMYWRESRNVIYAFISIMSAFAATLFNEMGIVAPVLILSYEIISGGKKELIDGFKRMINVLYLMIIPIYLYLRLMAGSHWFNGDYSYDVMKLPLNISENTLGYIILALFGTKSMSFYNSLRMTGKDQEGILTVLIIVLAAVCIYLYRKIIHKINKETLTVLLLGMVLFIVPLLPFLGLGNISYRYLYLSSFGILLTMVYLLMVFQKATKRHALLSYIPIAVLTFGIITFHISEINRINQDWKRAGDLTNNMLINFNDRFQKANATPPNPVFYFVNVPIKTGEAWIFPVGLPDALWFTFQNENLTVHPAGNLQLALDWAEASYSARVFEFNNDGSLEEVVRYKEIVPVSDE
jgi:hypothetical protein